MPASYPRGEGGFGISLPTALLSFPARLSAWIPTAPALTGPGGTGRWLSRSQSRTGTPGHRAWGGQVPARGLALLGELWHPVGAAGGVSPPGAVSPHSVHGWAPREGLRGSHVTQAPTSPPSCPGSQSFSWCLPIPPERVLAGAGARGSCPSASLQPPAGAALGTAGQGRGAGVCWRGSGLLSQRASDPQAHPGAPQPWLHRLWFNLGDTSSSTAPRPSWEGSGGPVLLQDSTAQTPVGQGPPAPRRGFPKASSQGPAPGCGCFSPGCAGVWGCSAGGARAGLG